MNILASSAAACIQTCVSTVFSSSFASSSMPKRKGHAGWSRHNRKALRDATRRRRAQETPYERAEKNERKKTARLRKQQERERAKRNEDRHERARNRNMPRRGIKRKAALSRNNAKRHRGAARSRREQEMQQKRIEHLRVQRERLQNRRYKKRFILTPVCDQKVEKLWDTSLLIQKSLQENSKEKMSATVTACKLNRSRNSTTIEDDTITVDLISNNGETGYRKEIVSPSRSAERRSCSSTSGSGEKSMPSTEVELVRSFFPAVIRFLYSPFDWLGMNFLILQSSMLPSLHFFYLHFLFTYNITLCTLFIFSFVLPDELACVMI
ncbi:DEAD-box ATP-dependent RNA helicase 42-like [Amblyraja radiata]|uniref:DEAD-box ATP-dependent RNA helicase 42-like n=1 Tax=Amblyraja radiata TaxID=386614 RepID=UPI001401EEBC|nr:DEAD-box ATP-dependent RNA helicase 42-like [Amblyraja radiata]